MIFKKMGWTGLLLLILISLTYAQEKQEAKKNQEKTKPKVEMKLPDKSKIKATFVNPDSLKGFTDVNANGIDDRIEFGMGKKLQNRKRDKFIDLNGDGICDGRESALGFKRAVRMRKGRGGKK